VLGYGRKTDVESGGDVSGRQLSVPHQAENLSAAGLRNNLQGVQESPPFGQANPFDGMSFGMIFKL
jgi:hypothetical protein